MKQPKKNPPALPDLPGVYLFKNDTDTILYIGKAKSLKKRVASYFHKYNTDWKVQGLLDEYSSIVPIITNTETEALLLEAQLIQQHKPKYNSLLKEGNPFIYILVTSGAYPHLKVVRSRREKGRYFGPFLHKNQARSTVLYLSRLLRLTCCNKKLSNGCLDYHIGNCAGSCLPTFSHDDYYFRIQLAINVLEKNHTQFMHDIQEKIKEYSAQLEFEKARNLNYYLEHMTVIFNTIDVHFSQNKYIDQIVHTTQSSLPTVTNDIATQLQLFFNHPTPISTIDCFDISHFQGKEIVGSCIRFTNGTPEKNKFRRFLIKTLTDQNDYAALQEIVQRRYKNPLSLPDLVLIDGGKGQLSAVQKVLAGATIASLAKKEERLFADCYPQGTILDLQSDIGRLLISLRDYAHHFAITYHRLRRHKTMPYKLLKSSS